MSNIKRYRASILLGALGDTLGYHNGAWEFCYNTKQIRKEFFEEGGLQKINLEKLIVSDDTILHLATIRSLLKGSSLSRAEELEIASKEYVDAYYTDMRGRAPGTTTGQSMALLKKGLRPQFNLQHKTCGGAMRASGIGLLYHKPEDLDELMWTAIEYCRLTHNGPLAYMGSFLNALLTSYAINRIPANQWIKKALETKERVKGYINSLKDGNLHLDYIDWVYEFLQCYQDFRYPTEIVINDNHSVSWDSTYPYFPENYEENSLHMDEVYEALSLEPDGKKSWSGSCGISSVIIAYDALIHAIYNNKSFDKKLHEAIYNDPDQLNQEFFTNAWSLTVIAGMLHSGDNDSTGIIVGGFYGALFGARGVTKNLIKDLEYLDDMWKLAADLYELSIQEKK